MPNHFFRFKQFTIQQDKTAMKVCTDACLFGAFVANEIKDKQLNSILDIGAGTGLLSLMLAQKNNTSIEAVEIDNNAYQQAKENIQQSPWKERVSIVNTAIQDYKPGKKFDYIISNPPFFENDLIAADEQKNAAKHDSTLTLQELLHNIERTLTTEGSFAVLLPHHRTNYFITAAHTLNFYPSKLLLVKQTPRHDYFRSITIFNRQQTVLETKEMIIKNEGANYSEEFITLLKDYYLYL
ncbi:tRNA1(Val) (adenine(37)-N6)-methyltransferase [Ferruginibacter sp.]